ncbi:MAG: peptidoglycan bridge formation glycyltransferase FemA/FemB family protein [Candidatus Levybacteria bacterium]|nr:peptidoglycan bridge formation glycyltransferase FemA/FemB family protein [Candidatus Levybacteria bacterium]
MFTVQHIDNQKQWEDFLQSRVPDGTLQSRIHSFYPFFQSFLWGEVQRSLGFIVDRLGLFSGKNLIGVCQIIDIKAKRGHYLHLRHGPVLQNFTDEAFDSLLAYVKNLAKEKNASFIRISPYITVSGIPNNFFKSRGFFNAAIHRMDGEVCWVLDTTKRESELLVRMRKTHRYLIKKAQGMDIEIVRTTKVSDIEKFLPLYKDLSVRKHFVPHRGVREEFASFSKADQEVLYLAQYDSKIISGAIFAFLPNMAIYRHSASENAYRNIPASYLIQWEAIKEAKKRGIKLYNFWGIADQNDKNHPWAGLTLFKTGFGGEKLEFIHAMDLPLSPLYWKTYAIELTTKLLKGY